MNELEQLMKLVKDLQERVTKGFSTEAVATAVQEEIKKAFAAAGTPHRRAEFDTGAARALAGRDMAFAINKVSPHYRRPSGWAEPMPTNRLFTPEVEELQKLNDYMFITAGICALRDGRKELPEDEGEMRGILGKYVKGLKGFGQFGEWHDEATLLAKALDTQTTAEGVEFVPTGFSRDLIDRVRILAAVGELFPEINMPTDPFKLPGKAFARQRAVKLSESTADSASKITAKTPGTRQVTLDAQKLGMRVLWSLELEEDSIIAIAPFLRDEVIEGLAYGLETAYINGDTTSPHQDNDTEGGAADLAEKTWIGLRKHAQANTVTQDLSTFSTANLRALRQQLGTYGANPRDLAWIVSVVGLIKMLGLAEVITLEKYGALATVITGELGRFDGIPVVVSEHMRDDVDATGVNSAGGPNTKSNLVLVNRRAWVRGLRRAPTIKSKEDIETDQLIAVVTWRGDFQRTQGTTQKHTGQGIKFS